MYLYVAIQDRHHRGEEERLVPVLQVQSIIQDGNPDLALVLPCREGGGLTPRHHPLYDPVTDPTPGHVPLVTGEEGIPLLPEGTCACTCTGVHLENYSRGAIVKYRKIKRGMAID